MSWGDKKSVSTDKVDTLVGEHSIIEGDISFSGGLHVDGSIKGNVSVNGSDAAILVLSEKGSIEGEIRVPHLVVNGMVTGDIHSTECVELAAQARVFGNVYYNKIEMAMGAEVNGSLVHLDEAERFSKDSNVVVAHPKEQAS